MLRSQAGRDPYYVVDLARCGEDALKLLGSWAATLDQAESTHATDPA